MYSCNTTTGQCTLDQHGSLSPGECIATCKEVPTPAPTPVMYSCNAGQCVLDPHGTQSPGECIATCTCVVQHNCGQLNGTVVCNTPFTGCNVCDKCCFAFNLTQGDCDSCFTDPAKGCGGNQQDADS